jgi:ribosomal protein S6E (S10)
VVTFSEEMNTSSVTYTCTPDPGGWSVVGSNGNQTATYSHNAFASETTYTFEITNGKDLGGNNLVAGGVPNPWTFTTEDVLGPQVGSTSPTDGAIDVLITADIVVNFNEEMNTSSVTYTCAPDPGGWIVVWSNGNQTATFSHTDFASETTYAFEITGGEDIAGNTLIAGAVPNPWTFTTEDVIEPQITSTTPGNGTMDVLITANVVVTFTEEMNPASVTYTCTPDPGGWSAVWSNGNKTVTYSHSTFTSETTYTFEITGGMDLAGNNLAAGPVPNPWIFTTEDVVGPQIISTVPSNGSVNILVNADIVVTFSEEMNNSTVTYSCTPDPGGWGVVWSIGNTVATYSHNNFASETLYSFEITGGQDISGNVLTAGPVPNPWTFTSEDVVAPQITSTSPVNGAIDVLVTSDVVVNFNEEMNPASITYTCTPDPGGWIVVWSNGNQTATFSHSDFASETIYTFEITGGQDTAGNNLAAGPVPNPWSFTIEDVLEPQISSTTPANGTIDVPITADVVVNFNEEMNTSSVTYTCTPDPGGWSVVWSNGNQTATYSHNDFDSETICTFEITGGNDPAGNALAAGPVPNPWSFTTEDAVVPSMISTSPVNSDSNVAQTANIIVTFSEAMNTSSITFASSPNPGGWFVSWSGGDTVASFSHDPFDAFTTYLFQITGAEDPAGNNLVAGAVPNPWSFTTFDSIFPSITMTLPIDGSTDIGPGQNVVVTFSEPMNTSSLTYSSFPDPGGWSVAWSSGDTVATFSHSAFVDTITHTFQIANAWDMAGNFLVPGAVPNPWTFTTADTTSPSIIATSPSDTLIDIPLGADIVVTFDEEMDPVTVVFSCTPDPGGWSVAWSSGDTVATYSHNAFDELTTYTFQIVGGEDLSGNSLSPGPVPNPWSFTTEDITVPVITVTTPSDGTQNIVLDENVIVTFSETMVNTTVTYTCIPDPGGWSMMWSGGNTVIALSHAPFASDTSYTFQITGGKDAAGNDLAAGAVPNSWSFSTLDSVPPTITLTLPTDGSMDVPLVTDVTATFSEAMDISSVTFICSPDPGGWSAAWSAGDTVAMFSHNDFDKSTVYTFQIISGRDIAGNNLAAGGIPNPWTFTTVANVPPTILSTPILSATEDVQYNHDVDAQDSDDVSLTYSLTTYPSGMTIDPATGLITWTPTNSQVGPNSVVVLVTDGDFDTDSQSFTVTVFNTNDPPAITSTPVTASSEDALYSYDVDASDIDGDALNFSLSTYPAGMSIDSAIGLISWTPVNSQVGVHSVLVQVSDGNGGTDTQSFTVDVVNTNDAPTIISSPVITATEDILYTYDVDATDIDSGDTLTYSLSAFPAGMTIDPVTGVISWTPVNGQVGINSVTVDVSDGNGGSDSQPFTITVSNSNDPPTFMSTPVTTATEDAAYTYDVDASDIDGDTVTYSLSTYPAGMTIDNASGLITWTSTNAQVGSNSVVVLISDGMGGSDTQSFSIDVTNTNDAPSIISTPVTTATEDALYSYDVDATDVDSGDTLIYNLSAFPTGMTIDPNTGAIFWIPTNSQVGVNSVTVVAADGNGSTDTQIFTITVANVNDAPTFTSSPLITATEDTQYSYDADATDIDVGDTLSYSLTTNPAGMTIDPVTGSILWTPINNQVGMNNVVVVVADGNETDTQSFTITVANTNDPPTITSIPITTATDDVLYFYDVDASDVDSGDTLTFSLTVFPTGMTIDPNSGIIDWTPDDSHVGPNSVTVLVSDGNGGSDTQSFTINVADANDQPGITSTAIIVATEDTQYTYDVNALDPDMDILDFSLTTKPVGMTIDSATGVILWTPTNNQVGPNNVVVQVLDGNGGSDTQSFTVNVANENDEPAINSTPIATGTEDTQYTYDVEADDIDSGDTLTYSLTTSPAGMTINPNSGLITWTPVNSQVGSNQVDVLVSDGNGGNDAQVFFITVSNTNDAPTFTSTPIAAGTEDVQYTYDVDATDVDVGDTLTYSLTTYPATMIIDSATGVITWTPENDDVGSNAVTVLIDDGNGGTNTQSFSIMVSNTNDPPAITSVAITTATQDMLYVYDVQADDIDSTDILTYTLSAFPEGMTINSGTGVISWSPSSTQIGDSSVTVEVFDGSGETDTRTFTITVANVNDPPVFTTQPKTTATEEAEYFYEVEASDDDGDTLTFSLLNYPAGMVIDSQDGTINWTPTNEQMGTHSIVIKVIDGNGGDTRQSFTITVADENDSPEITSTPITTATEEVVYAYDVEAQDSDLTDDTLVYELAVGPQGMQINSTAGIISWRPTNGQVGDNSIIIVVTDGRGGSDTQTFTLVVMNANDDPSISSTPVIKAKEDEQYLYDVDASDIDSGDTLVFSLMTAPDGMTIDSATGIINWIPDDADVGPHNIVVRVTDNASAFAIQSFAITVENVNDAPTMSGMMVDPETGTNRDIYKFQLVYMDPDDDSGSATLIVDGTPYEMTEVSGDPLTGMIFSIDLSLGARNHTFYFQIDDEEGHVVVSDSSEIFVSAVAVPEKEEKDFLEEWLPIPLWLFILILIIIIIAISVYLSRVKKQLKRQKQIQRQAPPTPLPQRIERQRAREWKPELPKEPPVEEEDEDEGMLEFT